MINSLLPDTEWFQVRGIPLCLTCSLHLMEKPDLKLAFPITENTDQARAYFAFYHLSHPSDLFSNLFR